MHFTHTKEKTVIFKIAFLNKSIKAGDLKYWKSLVCFHNVQPDLTDALEEWEILTELNVVKHQTQPKGGNVVRKCNFAVVPSSFLPREA